MPVNRGPQGWGCREQTANSEFANGISSGTESAFQRSPAAASDTKPTFGHEPLGVDSQVKLGQDHLI